MRIRGLVLAAVLIAGAIACGGMDDSRSGTVIVDAGPSTKTDSSVNIGNPIVEDSGLDGSIATDAGADASILPAGANVTLGGTPLTVGEITFWGPFNVQPYYSIFIKVSGGGLPGGSDVIVDAKRLGSGCGPTPADYQDVWLRHGGSDYSQYVTPYATTCGLNITSLPHAKGERFVGAFNGKVEGINTASGKSVTLDITFSAPQP